MSVKTAVPVKSEGGDGVVMGYALEGWEDAHKAGKPHVIFIGRVVEVIEGAKPLTGQVAVNVFRRNDLLSGPVLAIYKAKYRDQILARMSLAKTFYKDFIEAVEALPALIPDDADIEETNLLSDFFVDGWYLGDLPGPEKTALILVFLSPEDELYYWDGRPGQTL